MHFINEIPLDRSSVPLCSCSSFTFIAKEQQLKFKQPLGMCIMTSSTAAEPQKALSLRAFVRESAHKLVSTFVVLRQLSCALSLSLEFT